MSCILTFMLLAGVANFEDGDRIDERLQVVNVDEVYTHTSFDEVTLENDIALLHLAQPVTFNAFVGTVCLPSDIPGEVYFVDDNIVVNVLTNRLSSPEQRSNGISLEVTQLGIIFGIFGFHVEY